MWIKHGLPNAAVLLAVFLQSTTAVDCGSSLIDPTFSSQEELDNVVANCTVWIGDIKVATGWNGPLVLNNIVNLTGHFTLETSTNSSNRPSPFLTSIKAPQLRHLGFLDLWGFPNLTAITLPRLEQVQYLKIFHPAEKELHLKVSSLVNITDALKIFGNLPLISFPSLVEAGSIYIASDWQSLEDTSLDASLAAFGITVDFPVLVLGGQINVAGNISSISMPELVSAIRRYDPFAIGTRGNWDLRVWTSGDPLDVNLPSLWNVSDISLGGAVRSFSFSALEGVNGTFEFRPSINATFDPSPLQRANEISISGNITSCNLESLMYVDRLVITPAHTIDCDPAAEAWKRIHPDYNEEDMNGSWDVDHDYRCVAPLEPIYKEQEKEKRPFPKVAVGLSVGIGIPVWFFFMFALWHGRKEKKKAEEVAKIPPPDYEAEMAARRLGGGEVLPDYEPRRSQGSDSQPGSVIELVDMTRPSPHPPHPPEYEDAVVNGREVRSGGIAGTHEARSAPVA